MKTLYIPAGTPMFIRLVEPNMETWDGKMSVRPWRTEQYHTYMNDEYWQFSLPKMPSPERYQNIIVVHKRDCSFV